MERVLPWRLGLLLTVEVKARLQKSVGILPPKKLGAREQGDAYIEPNTPMLDIPEVQRNALLHELNLRGSTSKPIDLSPTCYAGLHMLAISVVSNQLTESIIVRDRMWSRAHK